MNKIFLKKSREKSLLKRHPWIYSGAIARVEGNCANGETVEIYSADNRYLACGAISPASQLAFRVWSFVEIVVIDQDFFDKRLREAESLRRTMQIPQRTSAWRLCASEADGLPGVTVDVYNDFASVQ